MVTYKFVNINHDAVNNIVLVEWRNAPTSQELKTGLFQALEIVKTFRSSKWIADVRLMGEIDPADEEWVNTTWFPSAIDAGIRKMGVIVSDDTFNQMNMPEVMSRMDNKSFKSQFFLSVEQAVDWLKAN